MSANYAVLRPNYVEIVTDMEIKKFGLLDPTSDKKSNKKCWMEVWFMLVSLDVDQENRGLISLKTKTHAIESKLPQNLNYMLTFLILPTK